MEVHYTALTGGLMVLFGSFLPWVSLGGILSVIGYQIPEGVVTIVIGLCVVVVSLYNIINKKDNFNILYPICGFLALSLWVYKVLVIQRNIKAVDGFFDLRGKLIEFLNIMDIGLWVIALGTLILVGVGFVIAFPKTRLKIFPNSFPENRYTPSPHTPQPIPRRKAFLSGMTGTYAGQQIPVPEEGLVIGRDPSQCSLVVQSSSVSRRHARISQGPTPDCWILEDLNSTNGTFVQERSSWTRVASPVTLTIFRRFRLGDDGNEFEIR